MVLAAALNFDSNEAKAYAAIAVGILGLAYLWLRPKLKNRRSDPLERAPFAGLSQQRSVEREFQNLLVEMAEMSRQISAQLDTRSEKLNQLIIEADAKIIELRRLQSQGVSTATTSPTVAIPFHTVAESADSQPEAVESTENDPRYFDIYTLAGQGVAAQEIARRLDRPRGEIELILALRDSSTGEPKRATG